MILSIIIPNFNSGLLLKKSLESIYCKKLQFSFEVLILDNCSTDHPENIIQKFPFDNLFFFSESDSGIYDAMNKGIKRAKGNWLYFLGSGDLILFTDISFLKSSQSDFFYGDVEYKKSKLLESGNHSLFDILRCNICHQRVFYKKTIFEKIGFFNLSYLVMADYDLNIRCFLNKEIRVEYDSILIATYLGDGFSSNNKDQIFEKSKPKLALSYWKRDPTVLNGGYLFIYFLWLVKQKFFYELSKRFKIKL